MPERRRADTEHPHAHRPAALLFGHCELNECLLQEIKGRRAGASHQQRRRRERQRLALRQHHQRHAVDHKDEAENGLAPNAARQQRQRQDRQRATDRGGRVQRTEALGAGCQNITREDRGRSLK